MIPDPIFLLALANASAAAYEEDEVQRKVLLDAARIEEIAYFQGSEDARALWCQPEDISGSVLAIQGTQFSKGELSSILANVDVEMVDLGGGARVHAGYLSQCRALSYVVKIPDSTSYLVTGHSMGGAVATLWGAGCGIASVTFGSPMSTNRGFWKDPSKPRPIRVIHACDFAPDYPPIGDFVQAPGSALWLHDGGIEELGARPTVNDSVEDHAIEAYIAALQRLVA